MVMRGTSQSGGCCLVLYLEPFTLDTRRRRRERMGEGKLEEKEEEEDWRRRRRRRTGGEGSVEG